jgi:hypothetical protein
MAFEVLRTPQVRDAVSQRMSRTERAGYEAARDELAGRGCVAGAYKLAATDGGDYPLCAHSTQFGVLWGDGVSITTHHVN